MCLSRHSCFFKQWNLIFTGVEIESIIKYIYSFWQEANCSFPHGKPPSSQASFTTKLLEAMRAKNGPITLFKKCRSLVGISQSQYILNLFLHPRCKQSNFKVINGIFNPS